MGVEEEQLLNGLNQKGWKKNQDGSYSAPGRVMGKVEARGPKQPTLPSLDIRSRKQRTGATRVGCRVTMVALRKRLLDPDAIAFSFKPLTDIIAETLGVDDADPAVEWEWQQVKITGGEEGVVVKIEMI